MSFQRIHTLKKKLNVTETLWKNKVKHRHVKDEVWVLKYLLYYYMPCIAFLLK